MPEEERRSRTKRRLDSMLYGALAPLFVLMGTVVHAAMTKITGEVVLALVGFQTLAMILAVIVLFWLIEAVFPGWPKVAETKEKLA